MYSRKQIVDFTNVILERMKDKPLPEQLEALMKYHKGYLDLSEYLLNVYQLKLSDIDEGDIKNILGIIP